MSCNNTKTKNSKKKKKYFFYTRITLQLNNNSSRFAQKKLDIMKNKSVGGLSLSYILK